MKKVIVAASAVMAMGMTTASAADLGAKMYKKAPPIVAAYDPWDVAFGASITNNYLFRGVSQSNNKPSVTAYFEPRFNVNKDLQLYIGTSASSISFTNRAALEIDGYFGIRPTFGAAAFDFGFWYYGYPGGECIDGVVGGGGVCPVGSNAVGPAFNVMKRDVSFYEGYAKFNYTFNDYFTMGVSDNYSPNFLNTGAWGNYAAVTAKAIAPSTWFGSSGVGMYASGEFGRQWLGTSDAFYGTGFTNPGFAGPFPGGIKYADYNTWNIGIGFTYKVFTLDLRYSDTNLSKGDCNAFTSDFTASGTTNITAINPGGAGSSWCGATGIVKLSADLTAMQNLK
jgi:uncharacterized protein (TIGR02001 family)